MLTPVYTDLPPDLTINAVSDKTVHIIVVMKKQQCTVMLAVLEDSKKNSTIYCVLEKNPSKK